MRKYRGTEPICKVEGTTEDLTGRGGLPFWVRYLERTGIYVLLTDAFGEMRKSRKGVPVWNMFKQIFCFLLDGTSRHLTYFDDLQMDDGYIAAIENQPYEMASSHGIKRLFGKFKIGAARKFQKILDELFVWRLKIEQPEVIILTVDTMVMDNDEAEKREGVQPTYKKKKGFQPLQVIWSGKVIQASFRGGKKNGNSGRTVLNLVRHEVKLIRTRYREDVTIIVATDSGFFDEVNFAGFDELDVGFVATGKMYDSVKEHVSGHEEAFWGDYDNGHQCWQWLEFGYRCGRWKRFYRAFYTRPLYDENGHQLLDFNRPDNVILTNIGVNPRVLAHCSPAERRRWLKPETIIRAHHQRGADELPHRGLKDFGFEQLPFKGFRQNMALYYCMLISFFLFETFKKDALDGVVPLTAYATTVRRKFVDFAAKIVTRSHQHILKINKAVIGSLELYKVWERCQNPPPILA